MVTGNFKKQPDRDIYFDVSDLVKQIICELIAMVGVIVMLIGVMIMAGDDYAYG